MRKKCRSLLAPCLIFVCCSVLGCQSPGQTSAATPQAEQTVLPTSTTSPEPSRAILTIQADGVPPREFTREELWNHPEAIDLPLPDPAAHSGQTITFRVVPMTAVFQGVEFRRGATLEFDSLDGFSASLDPALVLNSDPKKSLAYLAIEDPSSPWPKLKDGKSTAGPLYLVWKNPEVSGIGQEQWPFQIRSFSVKESIEARFPKLAPKAEILPNDPVYRGYQAFLKNCFSCHTLNGEGTSRMGPDLNEPHSPTEYLKEEFLRQLIRDPQSLRSWKGSRMSSFSVEMLPESELDDLILYLQHKAAERAAKKP